MLEFFLFLAGALLYFAGMEAYYAIRRWRFRRQPWDIKQEPRYKKYRKLLDNHTDIGESA